MVTGHGCYISPQHKIQMAQQHNHEAQGLISVLNIPIISLLA